MRHEHTDQCKKQHVDLQVERARYAAKWPNYCRKCHGEGFTWYTYDPSPAGVSLSPGSMEDCDPCPDCIEKGLCPRCGQKVWDGIDDWENNEPVMCPLCGWDESEPDSMPPEPECYCWVGWEKQELAEMIEATE